MPAQNCLPSNVYAQQHHILVLPDVVPVSMGGKGSEDLAGQKGISALEGQGLNRPGERGTVGLAGQGT